MDKYNEGEMVCTCYEEVTNIVFIPNGGKLVVSSRKVTLGPDGEEIGRSDRTDSAVVPEEDNLLDTLLAYRTDVGAVDPDIAGVS
jgi:hypothetical protein